MSFVLWLGGLPRRTCAGKGKDTPTTGLNWSGDAGGVKPPGLDWIAFIRLSTSVPNVASNLPLTGEEAAVKDLIEGGGV